MAKIDDASSTLRRTIFLTLTLTAAVIANSASTSELESTLSALRSHNYNLFANALITSDLLFELHSNLTTPSNNASISRTFTLFAPPDSALFALDMASTALVYTQTLRYHIVPRRIAASDLLNLRPGSWLPTLLPCREIRVRRRLWRRAVVVAVDEVTVVVPGLYYGDGIAVHGLAGVLNFRSSPIGGWPSTLMNRTGSNGSSVSSENQTFIPKVPKESPAANGSIFSPIPKLPILNDSIPPPAVNSPVPSSSIGSPPEMLSGDQSPQISPAAEEAGGELHESLTEESTERMRKHSAKLLEIELTNLTDDDDAVAVGVGDEYEMSDDGPSRYTGYEL